MLQIVDLSLSYAGRPLLSRFNLHVAAGEIVALLGPSGCGKSSLLKIIAGLSAADAGEMFFAGEPLAGLAPEARRFALMFQDFALFPHLDVLGNVMFGLIEQRVPKREAAVRAEAMLAGVGLAGFGSRRVWDLSGGEQQRVALARALITDPRLMLLDEPFSALDALLRTGLGDEFRRSLKAANMPAILVTHDPAEAARLADRIVSLS
ncbi:ABC transporter ATP-binding protein [Craterilacuibacter sp. RT1T]|uniref:ABC transporter ATP-binding protein n=1 Tax=Craterilacuibacter sp. RT1T TaxID=2942211 RepID=UPI0020C12DC3|nr:ABC transporter ATP-binding protein [Craterilacuibacter sp. RT1T]MCL6262534.1 ABC transporter ATP-binding protein [Craterilacuibacter sp. RT1T]